MRNIKGQFIKGAKRPEMVGENNPMRRPEVREKMSLLLRGRVGWAKGTKKTKEWIEKIRQSNLGQKRSPETKENNRKAMLKLFQDKTKHPRWQGGITPIYLQIRASKEYKIWRVAVFARDNYTCIWCGDARGGNLEADHIKPFAYYPELRFAIDNGRTLCHDCHKTTDTYGGKGFKKQQKISSNDI